LLKAGDPLNNKEPEGDPNDALVGVDVDKEGAPHVVSAKRYRR